MRKGKKKQLANMLAVCQTLDADVRYSTRYGHITVQAWDESKDSTNAEAIQRLLREQASKYPNIVCYCFDPYSTLIYVI